VLRVPPDIASPSQLVCLKLRAGALGFEIKQQGRPKSLDGQSVAIELQAALEANEGTKPRIVHDHGSEFGNRDVAAVIKAHTLIDIKARPRHPESNGIVERFNRTVRDETDNDYGDSYLRAEAIIEKLM
jgi:transposase InsO family protein